MNKLSVYILIIATFFVGFVLLTNYQQVSTTTYEYSPLPTVDPDRLNNEVLTDIVNSYRLNNGLNKLKTDNEELCSFAQRRLQETSVNWDHAPIDYYRNSLNYVHFGENLAEGYIRNKDVLDGWLASPTHKAILDNPDYTYVCTRTSIVGGEEYIVQLYASF